MINRVIVPRTSCFMLNPINVFDFSIVQNVFNQRRRERICQDTQCAGPNSQTEGCNNRNCPGRDDLILTVQTESVYQGGFIIFSVITNCIIYGICGLSINYLGILLAKNKETIIT